MYHDTRRDQGKVSFWNSAWIQGRWPKDIAPKIYNISRKKKRNVAHALHLNTWIRDLNISVGITLGHIDEFMKLWALVQNTELNQDDEDHITWKLTADGKYSAAFAYKA